MACRAVLREDIGFGDSLENVRFLSEKYDSRV